MTDDRCPMTDDGNEVGCRKADFEEKRRKRSEVGSGKSEVGKLTDDR
jgi:hypothetical protein